jgi:hypothetical protein
LESAHEKSCRRNAKQTSAAEAAITQHGVAEVKRSLPDPRK